jgi:hypothetical protein
MGIITYLISAVITHLIMSVIAIFRDWGACTQDTGKAGNYIIGDHGSELLVSRVPVLQSALLIQPIRRLSISFRAKLLSTLDVGNHSPQVSFSNVS